MNKYTELKLIDIIDSELTVKIDIRTVLTRLLFPEYKQILKDRSIKDFIQDSLLMETGTVTVCGQELFEMNLYTPTDDAVGEFYNLRLTGYDAAEMLHFMGLYWFLVTKCQDSEPDIPLYVEVTLELTNISSFLNGEGGCPRVDLLQVLTTFKSNVVNSLWQSEYGVELNYLLCNLIELLTKQNEVETSDAVVSPLYWKYLGSRSNVLIQELVKVLKV